MRGKTLTLRENDTTVSWDPSTGRQAPPLRILF